MKDSLKMHSIELDCGDGDGISLAYKRSSCGLVGIRRGLC